MSSEGTEVSALRLRERLHDAARLLGVALVVTDDAEWQVEGSSVRVGVGYYAQRGHGAEETLALAMVDLWASARAARVAPVRMRRRITLAQQHSELEPLLVMIDRLLAAGELLVAMPGLRGGIEAATRRTVQEDLQEWPRHLQWLGAVLCEGLTTSPQPQVAPEVQAELAALHELGGQTFDAVRRIMAPDPSRSQLQRFERALALLLPAYERLLHIDHTRTGLSDSGSQQTGSLDDDGIEGDPFGAGGDGDQEEPEGAAEHSSATSGETEDAARPGTDRDIAEGADLFAAEQAGFIAQILPTPMPARGAMVAELMQQTVTATAERHSADNATEQSAGASGHRITTPHALVKYHERVAIHSDAITRMRGVWQRVISERIDLRPKLLRQAMPEGEILDSERLATTVAEALAGVSRPPAYRQRAPQPKLTNSAGSTDYVLIIDRSGSMQGAADAAADAALVMLEALAGVARDIEHAERQAGIELRLGIRTALIVFDAEPVVVKPLAGALSDTARQALHAEVRSARGDTNDAAALREAAEQLGVTPSRGAAHNLIEASDGIERKRVVIMLSDGDSNDEAAAANELATLRRAGVHVYGIGIGGDELLRRFAPDSRRLDDVRLIPQVVEQLITRELMGPGN